jgi:hypothetical protein
MGNTNTMKKSFAVASIGLVVLLAGALTARNAGGAGPRAQGPSQITFAHDIAPITYQNCATCHHTGEVAPFPLVTYHDVAKRAQQIAIVTQSHYMPPWKASSNCPDFQGERRLTDAQIALIQKWVTQDAPEGNPRDLPPAPHFNSDWTLGPPDIVLQPKGEYHLAADGNDVYQCFVIPTNYTEDRYLSAVEVRPGNHRVVHHVIAYLDTSGKARQLAGNDPAGSYTSFGGPGFSATGSLGGWAPGMDPIHMPTGTGILLPKSADIVLQVHYHKDGKPEDDLTRIGLYFAKYPVDKQLDIAATIDPWIRIPAGDHSYIARANLPVLANITVLGVMPHMHLLGHDMTVTAALPDGKKQLLVKVPDWDFNWQTIYMYKDPLHLPKGSSISLVAHYDNSTDNARNPNIPPKLVTWGEQTTDEMCIAFVFFTVDGQHLTKWIGGGFQPAVARRKLLQGLIAMFDKNKDSQLDQNELAAMLTFFRDRDSSQAANGGIDQNAVAGKIIPMFDKDHDGKLDADELGQALAYLRNLLSRNAAQK